jgi:polysaccharide biosynthesis protein PslH
MGDILFLAHRLPYPPDRGDRIRSWHVLKALAKIAPVHVVAPLDDDADRVHLPTVARIAASVSVEVRSGSMLRAMARALWHGTPASVEAFVDRRLDKAVSGVLADCDIDMIYAYSGQMAWYVPADLNGQRFIMDFVDMDSAKFAQRGGPAHRFEARRLRAWELATAQRADVSLFVSGAEAALFSQTTGMAATVLENGIDTDHFAPAPPDPDSDPERLIVFTGQMDYAPNIAAVRQFAKQVLPRLNQARFAIVGRAPTAAVRALANDRVTVTGAVPDTRPWLARAAVVVAPLMLARGVQNKVLEAMAMGKAVVLSAAAAQGIDAGDGVHFIIADDPAPAINRLLDDPAAAAAIGAAARARMIERYGWDAQLAPLNRMIRP